MLIIDVRTPEEFSAGHLKGAILIEYQNILEDIEKYIDSKDASIGLYCAAGVRSEFATQALLHHGYHQAVNLGSFTDLWQQYPQLRDESQ